MSAMPYHVMRLSFEWNSGGVENTSKCLENKKISEQCQETLKVFSFHNYDCAYSAINLRHLVRIVPEVVRLLFPPGYLLQQIRHCDGDTVATASSTPSQGYPTQQLSAVAAD